MSVQRIHEIANRPVKLWQLALGLLMCGAVTFAAGSAVSHQAAEEAVETRDGEILELLRDIQETLNGLRPVSQTNHVEVSGSEAERLRDARIRAMLAERGQLKGD